MEPLHEDDPRRIGPYRIVGVLGAGGMGRVYLGLDDAGVEVAVKVVHADLARDPQYRKRFAREAEAASRMRGPHIASVLAADPDAPRPWLATEYVPAPSLWKAVTEEGPLPLDQVRVLGSALAGALAAVHAAGLVHRDVKPSNVLLGADGPYLIDFGIARDRDQSTMTRTGMLLGTPQFMAPEQVADRAGEPTGPPVDVFAFGGLLAFAATGKLVFGDGAPAALTYRIMHQEPDLDGVDEPLRSLLASCLMKDPDSRPTAGALARALRGGMGAVTGSAGAGEAGAAGDADENAEILVEADGIADAGDDEPTAGAGPEQSPEQIVTHVSAAAEAASPAAVPDIDVAADEPPRGRRTLRKALAATAAAVVLVVVVALTMGFDGGGGTPAVAAGGSPASSGGPFPSGSTSVTSTSPSPGPSSSPTAPPTTVPWSSVAGSSGPTGPGTTPGPAPGPVTVRTTTIVVPGAGGTTAPTQPARTTAPAPPPTHTTPPVYILRSAPGGTGGTRCLGTDGKAVLMLADCGAVAAHWKLHQGSGGTVQWETAFVPGQCMHSDEWDQLWTQDLSLATCAGTADGSQWFTEQAATGNSVRIHNPSPGHGGPTQDTCLRTAVFTSSDLAYIPGCSNKPEEMWLIGTWP